MDWVFNHIALNDPLNLGRNDLATWYKKSKSVYKWESFSICVLCMDIFPFFLVFRKYTWIAIETKTCINCCEI